MAVIGQALASPEQGWRRYEESDGRFAYTGNWTSQSLAMHSGGTIKYTGDAGANVKFKFYGTKLRIIVNTFTANDTTTKVTVDGVDTIFSTYSATDMGSVLIFETTNLPLALHSVTITKGDSNTSKLLRFDAVDIDDTGKLVHPYLTERTSLADMEIGDVILCEYVASSGAVGVFSKLGSTTAGVIPPTSTATPNGAFYFIKVKEGLLIADRIIQHSIAWTTLNAAQIIEGMVLVDSLIPTMTSNTAPSGRAFADRANTNYGAFKAFDQSKNTIWATLGGTSFPTWVGYEFTTPKVVDGYSIQASAVAGDVSSSPKSWKFEGSNDGVEWVTLDTVVNTSAWTVSEVRKYSFENTATYKMYRLKIEANQGGAYPGVVASLEMGITTGLIRTISGGVAWADTNGNFSTTNQSKGCFPTANEWDTYVLGSTLGGKITKGDPNIWNLAVPVSSICMETNADGVTQTDGSTASVNTRVLRGRYNASAGFDSLLAWGTITTAYASVGFRPVMEYIDPKLDSSKRPSTLWY